VRPHKHTVQQQKRSPTTNPNYSFSLNVARQFIFAAILLEYSFIFQLFFFLSFLPLSLKSISKVVSHFGTVACLYYRFDALSAEVFNLQ